MLKGDFTTEVDNAADTAGGTATGTVVGHAIDFGLADYETIHAYQHQLVTARLHDQIPDTLLMGEHLPVYTVGRKITPSHFPQIESSFPSSRTIPLRYIERGGDITYHGPGQLVVYPILKLSSDKRDLHQYLRFLEEQVIRILQDFQVVGFRQRGLTGVWVSDRSTGKPKKVASIGIAVKKWVTYHGVALNLTTALQPFHEIQPCGLTCDVMTTLAEQRDVLERETGSDTIQAPLSMTQVKKRVIKIFSESLNQPFVPCPFR